MVFSDGGYGGGGDCRSPCPSTTKRGSSEGGGVKVKEEPTTYEGDGSNSDGSSSSSSSSSSSTSSPKPTEDEAKRDVVNIKEERMDYLMDDEYEGIDCFINSGSRNYNNINTTTDGGSYSSPSSSSLVLPKPMECLLETGPPPFLNKTFQIVDDPETDPIVSWSEARQSFVVWDPHEFSKTLLPNYFKHSNFSSFIRQLNTYGFKKIDPDRWEFANEGFQGGKKHLLKSIKKRSRYRKQQQGSTVSANSTKKARLEEQLETLKKDQDVLKFEILNLKQQQKYSQHQLTAVKEQIRSSECKQQRMMLFLTKVTKNCNFVQRIMHKRMLDGGDLGKRRRLLSAQGFENSGDCGTRVQVFDEQLPEEVVPQLEVTSLSASVLDKSCNQKPEADVLSVYDNMSDKLLQENSVFHNEFAVNDSNFYQELEDLITEPHELVDLNVKPCDWSGYVSNCLVEQAGCVGSMP